MSYLVNFDPELQIFSESDHGGRFSVPANDSHSNAWRRSGVCHDVRASRLKRNSK